MDIAAGTSDWGCSMSDRHARFKGWAVWLQWLLACAVGWGVSGAAFRAIYSTVGRFVGETIGEILGLVAFGGVVGTGQWLVLRRQMCRADRWAWMSATGAAVGVVVSQWLDVLDIYIGPGMELDDLLAGAGFGIVLGVVQWWVLRGWAKAACRWILASVAGGAASFFVAQIAATMVRVAGLGCAVDVTVGIIYGTVTGFVLVWLLRDSVSEC